MDEKIAVLRKNNIFDVVPIPKRRKLIDSNWVYKDKLHAVGTLEQRKARGVAEGFSEVPGTDFDEFYALVVRYESQQVCLAI